jgi:ankyrin repeat protein
MGKTTKPIAPGDALRAAIESGNTAAAEEVLRQHADFKAHLDEPLPGAAFGSTPLLTAVGRGDRAMVEVLLGAGADINARSHWWAGSFGVLDIEHGLNEFLIQRGATVDAHAAARLDMLDRLEALASADPGQVHARGGDGQLPLHFAATERIAAWLLDHGAEIDVSDIDHESTAAQWMVKDRPEVARYLVSRGCRTDILMAAALGDLELVRRHLDDDPASIRTTVSEQYFPKQNPHSGGSIYIYTFGSNRTPHQLARAAGHDDVFNLLMDRSPLTLQFTQACLITDSAAVDEFLAHDPGVVSTLSSAELAALVSAAMDSNIAAVTLMLAAGWPPGATAERGVTALHWAAFHGNAIMAPELLRRGAPTHGRDGQYGAMPLGWAIHGSLHGWHPERGDYGGVVSALIDAGVEPPSGDVATTPAVLEVLKRSSPSQSSG